MDYDRTTMLFMTIGAFMMVIGQIIEVFNVVFYMGLGWFISSTTYGFIMERIMSGRTIQSRYKKSLNKAKKDGKKNGQKEKENNEIK